MISLSQALALAVGPANVAAAGHAVADWFDDRSCSGAADVIRKQLQDYVAPHNRPDTSLRAELMAELASQQEVVSSLRERVERLERRWVKEAAGGDKLDRLIAQDREADEPAVSEDREPAAVVEEPSDEELLGLMHQSMRDDLAEVSRLAALEAGTAAGVFRVTLNYDVVRFARAVLARWGHQPAPPAEGEVGDEARRLAKELRDQADDMSPALELFGLMHRAADLLEQRHPEPVPISERLPGPEDCDGDGRCWLFSKVEKEWRLLDVGNPGVPHLKYCFSHSLPATALPLPQQETPND